MTANAPRVCVGRFINEKFNYMYEFEKHEKLTEFIQEMANTGKAPKEWTSFIETLNEALRIHDVVGRSEQYCDWCSSTKEVEVKICKRCRQGMENHR